MKIVQIKDIILEKGKFFSFDILKKLDKIKKQKRKEKKLIKKLSNFCPDELEKELWEEN